MENTATMGPRAAGPRLTKANVFTKRYTEADITRLEAGDLTDPMVLCALHRAYEQNDPAEVEFRGIRRDPSTFGSEATLKARLARAEAALEQNPKDCQTRKRRLDALSGLACLRKHETHAQPARG